MSAAICRCVKSISSSRVFLSVRPSSLSFSTLDDRRGREKILFDLVQKNRSTFDRQSVRSVKSKLKYSFGYQNFGHRENVRPPGQHVGQYLQLMLVIVGTYAVFYLTNVTEFEDRWTSPISVNSSTDSNQFVDYEQDENKSKLRLFSEVKAETRQEPIESNEPKNEKGEGRISFRDKKKIAYENRIRSYSTPDKIFRYFATYKIFSDEFPDGVICMTPEDFLRSISPGWKQEEGLELDKFIRLDVRSSSSDERRSSVFNSARQQTEQSSIFEKIAGKERWLTFSDFIFLLTVLSTPRRYFQIAFQMFDLDGNGNIDFDEFSKLNSLIREQTMIGQKHRDHSATGNILKDNSTLNKFFFGENLDQILTIDKFLDFYEQLQREILHIEFSRSSKVEQSGKEERMTELDFSSLLLTYSGLSEKRIKKMLKRVKKSYSKSNQRGISFDDYLNFNLFMRNIHDVDVALTFYHIAGRSIDKQIFRHVAKTVNQVELDEHLVDVVFTLFDENQDELLSYVEFIQIIKNRLKRGLEKPKDTSFIKLFSSFVQCAKETYLQF